MSRARCLADTRRGSLRFGTARAKTSNKNELLAHIHDRLQDSVVEDHDGDLPDWLVVDESVNLHGFEVSTENTGTFYFRSWLETPNPTFDNRTPSDVIKRGRPEERRLLALAIDAIGALEDGAFS